MPGKILTYILISCNLIGCTSPVNETNVFSLLENDIQDLGVWESELSASEKQEIIKKLDRKYFYNGDPLVYYERSPDDYRFADFDNDNDIDLIVISYFGGADAQIIKSFANNNGRYDSLFHLNGHVVYVSEPKENSILELKVLSIQPATAWSVNQVYHFQFVNNKVKVSERLAIAESIEMPEKYLEEPITFQTLNDVYNLRAYPQKDKPYDGFPAEIEDNILATYQKSSRGKAVASKMDKTGKEWWFVIMEYEKNNPPEAKILATPYITEKPYNACGWMSSKYLQELKDN